MRTTILVHAAAVLVALAIYAPNIHDWFVLTFTDRIAFVAP